MGKPDPEAVEAHVDSAATQEVRRPSPHASKMPCVSMERHEEMLTVTAVPLVEMTSVSKAFFGVPAISAVNLAIYPGEVVGLVGRNGAGKTTLMNVLTGMLDIDSGQVRLAGRIVERLTPMRAAQAGIAVVPQQLRQFENLSVSENLLMGKFVRGRFGGINWAASHREAAWQAEEVGLELDVRQEMSRLTVGEQQMVSIARAIFADANLIILDEPTAALGARDVELLFNFVRNQRNKGVSFVYISHHLEEVFQLCDRVTILRDGRDIASRSVSALGMAELVGMLGGGIESSPRPQLRSSGEPPAIEAKQLSVTSAFEDVSFTVLQGEVLGITGLEGSGKEQLAQALTSLDAPPRGFLAIDGIPVRLRDPREALSTGLAYLPRDRKRYGAIGVRSVRENLSLASLNALKGRFGFLSRNREHQRVSAAIKAYSIEAADERMELRFLSGGNQQKVVFAKLLETVPKILVLEDPTQGVDIGAKGDIWRIINSFTEEGGAVILVSEVVPELLEHCHRVLVMHRGRCHRLFDLTRDQASPDEIIAAIEGIAS